MTQNANARELSILLKIASRLTQNSVKFTRNKCTHSDSLFWSQHAIYSRYCAKITHRFERFRSRVEQFTQNKCTHSDLLFWVNTQFTRDIEQNCSLLWVILLRIEHLNDDHLEQSSDAPGIVLITRQFSNYQWLQLYTRLLTK